MRRKILHLALSGTLLLAGIPKNYSSNITDVGAKTSCDIKRNNLENELENAVPRFDEIPKLKKYNIKENHCSQYARQAAKYHFDKKYLNNNAWDLKYDSETVTKFNTNNPYKELDSLRQVGKLKPGMAITVYNPNSRENNKRDKKGKIRDCTHVILYMGKDQKKGPTFDHQWRNPILRVDTSWLKKRNLRLVEILDEPKNF